MATKPNNLVLNPSAPKVENIVLAYPLNEGVGSSVANLGRYGTNWAADLTGTYTWVTDEGGGINSTSNADGVELSPPENKSLLAGTIIVRMTDMNDNLSDLYHFGLGGDGLHRARLRNVPANPDQVLFSMWGDPDIRSMEIVPYDIKSTKIYTFIVRWGGSSPNAAMDIQDNNDVKGSNTGNDDAYTQGLELNVGDKFICPYSNQGATVLNIVVFDTYLDNDEVTQYLNTPYLMYVDSTTLSGPIVKTSTPGSRGTYLETTLSMEGVTETQWHFASVDGSEFFITTTADGTESANVLDSSLSFINIWLPPFQEYGVRVRRKIASWTTWSEFINFTTTGYFTSHDRYLELASQSVTIPES